METINYTVIIPNKNQPFLLQRCINSIPERKDIQIIVVDDNSDPNIINFKNYPGNTRKNVEVVYTKEGKGAGYARNVGMSHAKGKWLLFADSDDFYNQEAFDELSKYVNSSTDVIYFNVNSVDTNTLKPSNRDKNFQKYIDLYLDGKDKNGDNIKFRKWEPWNKMIRREFIKAHNITFDEIPRCNDMIFSLLVSFYAKHIEVTDSKIYCVTTNPQSITKTKIKKNVFWHCIICEMKKNYIYGLIHHKFWQSKYIFLTICLLKNNGLFETLSFYWMIIRKRRELQHTLKNFKLKLQNHNEKHI